jgi:hypothetical protein
MASPDSSQSPLDLEREFIFAGIMIYEKRPNALVARLIPAQLYGGDEESLVAAPSLV